MGRNMIARLGDLSWVFFAEPAQGANFAQAVHRFPQRFDQNLIDGASGNYYLARQIEPGSLRTLRLGLEDAASLTAGCAAD